MPRPRAWLTLLALGLAFLLVLGAFARTADAQAFKPRSRNGIAAKGLKKAPATATAAAPAGTPATAPAKAPPKKAPAAAPTAAAKPGPAKKPAKKKSKGDDDDEVTVTDGDD